MARPHGTAEAVAFSEKNAAHLTNGFRGVAAYFTQATGHAWTVKGVAVGGEQVGWALVSATGARTDFKFAGGTLVAVSVSAQQAQPVVIRVPVKATLASITSALEGVLFPQA